jgi:hypothetical protein
VLTLSVECELVIVSPTNTSHACDGQEEQQQQQQQQQHEEARSEKREASVEFWFLK